MIYRDCIITISKGASTLNETIMLYRGDREVELYFTIKDSKYKFTDTNNLITITDASYAQIIIKVPSNNFPIFGEILPTKDGKAVLKITSTMIDEIEEVGLYDFQIRLYDESKTSRVTIPPIEKGIEVREPIAIEDVTVSNEVGIATVGYAEIGTKAIQRPTLNKDGTYNKKVWADSEIITKEDLNVLEDISDKNTNEIKTKVDKVTGKSLIADTEMSRLAGIVNYVHPTTHLPSIIVQDSNNRFVTDTEKSTWNGKSNFDGNYNNLTNKPVIPSEYALPIATSTTLGGIKVGAGLTITSGVLSVSGGGVADSVEWANVQNKPSVFAPATHVHSYNDLTDKPTIPTVTNDLTSTLKTNYDTAYTHSQSSHAPSTAQKNSDITKDEIEAKLVGVISSHSHEETSSTGSGSSADIGTIINSTSNIQTTSYNAKPIRPLISFSDDDGKVGVYTKWKPILEEKGIPLNICIITGTAGNNGYLTWEQIKELQNNYGCEILSHTVTHANISTHETNKTWIEELKQSKLTLMKNGLNVRGFAYPNGGIWGTKEGLVNGTSNGYWMTGLFYDYGVVTGGTINSHPLTTNMGIDRAGIGCYEATGFDTLEGMKAKVDECIAKNGWLVFMTHVDDVANTDEDINNIKLLIDYIKSKNVDIVTLSEGFEIFGNAIETPNCKITKQGSATLNVASEVPNATENTAGIVQVGSGISVADGIISVDSSLYYSKEYLDNILDTMQTDILNLKNNQGSGTTTNSSPTVSSISAIKASPGTNFNITYTAVDSDGIQLHELSMNNGTDYNTIVPIAGEGNSFTYTTSIAIEGVYYCKLKVTDTLGNSTIKSFGVTVETNKIILSVLKIENNAQKIDDTTFNVTNTESKYDVLFLGDTTSTLIVGNSYKLCFQLLENTLSAAFDVGATWNVTQDISIFNGFKNATLNEIVKVPFTLYLKPDTFTNKLIYFQLGNTLTGNGYVKFKIWIEG